MHILKAHDDLVKLASAPANLDTFVKATVLLDGLVRESENIDIGERVNGTVRIKIGEARSWFESLCGVGDDGLPQESIRSHIRAAFLQSKNRSIKRI